MVTSSATVIQSPAAIVRPALPRFVAAKFFTAERFDPAALSPHFRNSFLDKVEAAQAAAQLRWDQSSNWSNRAEMEVSLAEWARAHTTLADLAWLIDQSSQGGDALIADGGLNLFNILDGRRQPRCVVLFKYSRRWNVGLTWADYDGWLKSRQVRFFSVDIARR